MTRQLIVATLALAWIGIANDAWAVDPPVTTNLYAWYHAGSLGLGNGADVSAWGDSSGNGHDLSLYGDGTLPGLFQTTGFNGQPAVQTQLGQPEYTNEFDETIPATFDTALRSDTTFGMSGDPAYTLFVVAQTPSAFATDYYAHPFTWGTIGEGDGVDNVEVQFQAESGNLHVAGSYGFDFASDYTAPTSANLLLSISKSPGPVDSTTLVKVDGATYNDDGTSTTLTPTIGDEYAWIGRGVDIGTTGFYDGLIAEIILYDRVLSTEEENEVGYYLEQKYGLDTQYVPPVGVPEPSSTTLAFLASLALAHMTRKRRSRQC